MKRVIYGALICFAFIFLIGLFSVGSLTSLTGQITQENIIVSISPQGEYNNKALHIEVLTSEKAKCMYNLGTKNTVALKYFDVMTVTGGFKHSQLLKDLKDNEYDLSIKCTDEGDFAYTRDVDLIIKLPEECIPYCEYVDDCTIQASDGCGSFCKRETNGRNCGEGLVCNEGSCITEEKPSEEAAEETTIIIENVELSPAAEEHKTLSELFWEFLKGLFS